MYSLLGMVYQNGTRTGEFDLVRDAIHCHGYSLEEAQELLRSYLLSGVCGGATLTYLSGEYKLAYDDGVVEYLPAYPVKI